MIGMIEYATSNQGSAWGIASEIVVQMAVGFVVGVIGGRLLIPVMQRVTLPREGLYPIRILAVGAAVYGVASALHGSGFLAVFIVGLLIGDVHAPYKTEIDRFHTALASLAEIAVFIALGLTIFGPTDLWDDLPEGVVLFLFLALVARPLAVALLLLRARLRRAEKVFIAWGGLKGAVPILLAAFAIVGDVPDAPAIYNIVFVVVLLSVLVQGSTIPLVAHRLGIPMRLVEPEPWDVSIRLREPGAIQRYTVGPRSRVLGSAIRDLPLGERAWVSFVVQDGKARQARGSHVFRVGDEVHVLGDPDDERVLQRLFEGPDLADDDRGDAPGRRDAHDAARFELRDVRVLTHVDGDPDRSRQVRDDRGRTALGPDAEHAALGIGGKQHVARRSRHVDDRAEAGGERRDPSRGVHASQDAVVRVRDDQHAVAAPEDVVRVTHQRLSRGASVARVPLAAVAGRRRDRAGGIDDADPVVVLRDRDRLVVVDVEAAGAAEPRRGGRPAVAGVAAHARSRDDDLALAVDPVDAIAGRDVEAPHVVVRDADDRFREARGEHRAPLRAQVEPNDALESPVADHERTARVERERAGRRDANRLRFRLRLRVGLEARRADRGDREQDQGELAHWTSIHRPRAGGHGEPTIVRIRPVAGLSARTRGRRRSVR